jgi:hypothetical protein
MNQYQKMKNEHQKRVNALPIKFAFSTQQFREAMEGWGLTVDDTDKIYKLGSTGGFYRREDSQLIFSTLEQNAQEMEAAIAADKDGTGFIKDMFRYELANHEYCITYDLEPTLDALNLTEDEVLDNPALKNGLILARREYLAEAEENGWG